MIICVMDVMCTHTHTNIHTHIQLKHMLLGIGSRKAQEPRQLQTLCAWMTSRAERAGGDVRDVGRRRSSFGGISARVGAGRRGPGRAGEVGWRAYFSSMENEAGVFVAGRHPLGTRSSIPQSTRGSLAQTGALCSERRGYPASEP